MTTQEQAYISGFVKRANQYSYSDVQAIELLKESALVAPPGPPMDQHEMSRRMQAAMNFINRLNGTDKRPESPFPSSAVPANKGPTKGVGRDINGKPFDQELSKEEIMDIASKSKKPGLMDRLGAALKPYSDPSNLSNLALMHHMNGR